MININVKNIQNGKIVSETKEVIEVYASFIRYEDADKSFDNIDLQQRLNPIANINTDDKLTEGSFSDSFENINLQNTLYTNVNIDIPADSNIKPNKIVQIWAFTNGDIRKIFSLISSCFGSGTWVSSEKWINTELWKSN